jgi:hypothetical protein
MFRALVLGIMGIVTATTVVSASPPAASPMCHAQPGYSVPMIFTLVGGQSTLNIIDTWPDGYIQDRDIILLTKRQFEEADTLEINTLADNVRARFPKVKIGVRTFGQKYMRNLKNAPLSSNITILSYVYEPRWSWGDEPEFSKDFTKTLVNYQKLQREMKSWTNQGKEIWTEPTGQGLPHRNYTGWNYAEIDQYVDVVAIQAQHNAQEEWDGSDPNSFTDAIAQVSSDMGAAGVSIWFMQISIGAEVNGIPGQPAYEDVFEPIQVPSNTPGLHLWVNPQSVAIEGKAFMDGWAPKR